MKETLKHAIGTEIVDSFIQKWEPEYGDEFPDLFEMKIKLVPKKLEGEDVYTRTNYLDDDRFKTMSMYIFVYKQLLQYKD